MHPGSCISANGDEDYFKPDFELGTFTHCFINETYFDKGDEVSKRIT